MGFYKKKLVELSKLFNISAQEKSKEAKKKKKKGVGEGGLIVGELGDDLENMYL